MNFEIPFAASKTTIARGFVPIDPSTGKLIDYNFKLVVDLGASGNQWYQTGVARLGVYSKVPFLCFVQTYSENTSLNVVMCPWKNANNWYFILGEIGDEPFVRQGELYPYRVAESGANNFVYRNFPWKTTSHGDEESNISAFFNPDVTGSLDRPYFYDYRQKFRAVNGKGGGANEGLYSFQIVENNLPLNYRYNIHDGYTAIYPDDPLHPLATYVNKTSWNGYCRQHYPEYIEEFT